MGTTKAIAGAPSAPMKMSSSARPPAGTPARKSARRPSSGRLPTVGDQTESRLSGGEIARPLGTDETIGKDRAEQQQGKESDAGDGNGPAGELRAKVPRGL